MKIRLLHITFLLCLFTGSVQLYAQVANERTRILFLLDASGSMSNTWNDYSEETKIASAKKILTEIADSLAKETDVELGLRVYGHQSPPTLRNCKDTQLEVGFSRNSTSYIKTKLKEIRPKGITPIAYSLEKAGTDFPNVQGRNIIILMTDGEESCEGDPCEIARLLEKRNVVLKHFVIGIGTGLEFADAFNCIGTFFNVDNQNSMRSVLDMIIKRVLNETTSQVDLLDDNGQALETDVNMTFNNSGNGLFRYDFYHTMNAKGLPDTLSIDAITDYDITVHTIPPVVKKGITLIPNQHNHIQIDAGQGNLEVLLQGPTMSSTIVNKIKCLVRKSEGEPILHVQNINSTVKYLSGTYDLEILTLPRTYIKNVNVIGEQTAAIQIPTPGIANLVKKFEVYGGIFVLKENRLEKILELNANSKIENIALQPGDYYLIFRPRNTKTMHSSKTIQFSIKSGESISLNL